jgi:PAS domain-containing protein
VNPHQGTKVRWGGSIQGNDGKIPKQRLALTRAVIATIVGNKFLDGTVITANSNFLAVVGYTAAEVVGKHHRIFVDSNYANAMTIASFGSDSTAANLSLTSSSRFRRAAK